MSRKKKDKQLADKLKNAAAPVEPTFYNMHVCIYMRHMIKIGKHHNATSAVDEFGCLINDIGEDRYWQLINNR